MKFLLSFLLLAVGSFIVHAQSAPGRVTLSRARYFGLWTLGGGL